MAKREGWKLSFIFWMIEAVKGPPTTSPMGVAAEEEVVDMVLASDLRGARRLSIRDGGGWSLGGEVEIKNKNKTWIEGKGIKKIKKKKKKEKKKN